MLFTEIASVTGQTAYTGATTLTNRTYDYQVRAAFQQWTATTPLLCL